MELRFTYLQDDFDALLGLGVPQSNEKPKTSYFGWILFIALAVLVVLTIRPKNSANAAELGGQSPLQSLMNSPVIPWTLVGAAITFFSMRLFFRTNTMRLADYPDLQDPHVVTISEASIVVATSTCTTTFKWGAFCSWSDNSQIIVLWREPAISLVIPARAVQGSKLDELRSFLDSHISSAVGKHES